VLDNGLRTPDIAGGATTTLSTSEMGDAILEELRISVR
jgi:isocitrate/isopropylmalate dehydrogenase